MRRPLPAARSAAALCAATALALNLGCGAAEDAPAPDNPPGAAFCPSAKQVAPGLLRMVRAGELDGLAALLGERLSEAQLDAVLAAGLDLIRQLSPAQLEAILALTDNPRLLALGPLVADLLDFVVGDPTDPASFRADATAELRRLLTICEAGTLFTALDGLLQAPELPRLLGGLGDVLALDIVRQILMGDVRGALERDGFTVLVCNIVAALVAPGFSVQRDVIDALAGIDLLPTGAPPLSTFLADLAALLDPARPLLPALTDLVCCDLYGVPRCDLVAGDAQPLARPPVFTELIYDLFVSDVVDIDVLLRTLGALAVDPQVNAALEPVGALLRVLGEDAELRRVLLEVLVLLLDGAVAREVLPELVVLIRTGGVEELLAVVRSIAVGCEPPSMPVSP